MIRLPSPACTCLLFPNGAVTAVGIKTFDCLDDIISRLCSILPANGDSTTVQCQEALRVCNIVASTCFRPVNLSDVYNALKSHYFLTFTPETFPALKVRLSRPLITTRYTSIAKTPTERKTKGVGGQNLVAVVFHTGKINITGARTMEDIHYANRKIRDIINDGTMRVRQNL